jgi:hypothetical protein
MNTLIAIHRELPAKLVTPSTGDLRRLIERAGAPEPGRARFAPTSAMSWTETRRVKPGASPPAASDGGRGDD